MTPARWCTVLAFASTTMAQQPPPPADIAIAVTTSATDLEFGVAFSLTVVRRCRASLSPEPWNDEQLAPLTLELLDVELNTTAMVIEETRRYRAFLFATGEITVPAPYFRASDAASRQVAIGDDLHFNVRSALPAEDSGAIELPLPLYAAPHPEMLWAAALAAALAAASGLWWLRRRNLPPPAAPPRPTAATMAMTRLTEMRRHSPRSADEIRADAVAGSEVLRQCLATRLGGDVTERTTHEWTVSLNEFDQLPATDATAIVNLLEELDVLKFARGAPSAEERAARLDRLEALVSCLCSNGEPTQ